MNFEDKELPEPTKCDSCGRTGIVCRKGKLHYYWKCTQCGARVSCVGETRVPLGYMAPNHIVEKRTVLHRIFDPIWVNKLMSRDQAYIWLAQQLSIAEDFAHISRMTEHQLDAAVSICEKYRESFHSTRVKRELKRDRRTKKVRKEQFRHFRVTSKDREELP